MPPWLGCCLCLVEFARRLGSCPDAGYHASKRGANWSQPPKNDLRLLFSHHFGDRLHLRIDDKLRSAAEIEQPLALQRVTGIPGKQVMWFSDLQTRRLQPEQMDDPHLDPAEHVCALRDLRRLNKLSRTAAHIWREIKRLPHSPGAAIRVLDVASGGGDVALALARLAARHRRLMEVTGCDVSQTAVSYSRRQASAAGLSVDFEQLDAVRDPLPEGFDVIMCSLFLHHLSEHDAGNLLRRMAQATRCLVMVSDLLRTSHGYCLAWLGPRLLAGSRVVWHDAPISVAAAFSYNEVHGLADRAGLKHVRIRRCWPERFLLVWQREQ